MHACPRTSAATEVRDVLGDIRLTKDESPYVLVSDLTFRSYDADESSGCSVARETLTVEAGVEVDLQGYDVRVEGGAVDIDGATVTGSWAYFYVDDRTVCGEVWQGRATVAGATLSGVSLDARDAASLTVSDSEALVGDSGSRIWARERATMALSRNEIRGNVVLDGRRIRSSTTIFKARFT
ncbi:MAG: hypothetical protein OXL38_02425 [Gammaproteobacteria bacterium]|nr:hypothetical protein [Gammaproteobacteria bacterium]